MIDSSTIEAFTDGGCIGNPGPGGWACLITRRGAAPVERSGAAPSTTNNRMELTAVIRALQAIAALADADTAPVVVYTDSTYVQQGITAWIKRWRANGWRTAAKKPVKNADLWRELDALAQRLEARFRWVRGHAGDVRNERCHLLVHGAIAAAAATTDQTG